MSKDIKTSQFDLNESRQSRNLDKFLDTQSISQLSRGTIDKLHIIMRSLMKESRELQQKHQRELTTLQQQISKRDLQIQQLFKSNQKYEKMTEQEDAKCREDPINIRAVDLSNLACQSRNMQSSKITMSYNSLLNQSLKSQHSVPVDSQSNSMFKMRVIDSYSQQCIHKKDQVNILADQTKINCRNDRLQSAKDKKIDNQTMGSERRSDEKQIVDVKVKGKNNTHKNKLIKLNDLSMIILQNIKSSILNQRNTEKLILSQQKEQQVALLPQDLPQDYNYQNQPQNYSIVSQPKSTLKQFLKKDTNLIKLTNHSHQIKNLVSEPILLSNPNALDSAERLSNKKSKNQIIKSNSSHKKNDILDRKFLLKSPIKTKNNRKPETSSHSSKKLHESTPQETYSKSNCVKYAQLEFPVVKDQSKGKRLKENDRNQYNQTLKQNQRWFENLCGKRYSAKKLLKTESIQLQRNNASMCHIKFDERRNSMDQDRFQHNVREQKHNSPHPFDSSSHKAKSKTKTDSSKKLKYKLKPQKTAKFIQTAPSFVKYNFEKNVSKQVDKNICNSQEQPTNMLQTQNSFFRLKDLNKCNTQQSQSGGRKQKCLLSIIGRVSYPLQNQNCQSLENNDTSKGQNPKKLQLQRVAQERNSLKSINFKKQVQSNYVKRPTDLISSNSRQSLPVCHPKNFSSVVPIREISMRPQSSSSNNSITEQLMEMLLRQ